MKLFPCFVLAQFNIYSVFTLQAKQRRVVSSKNKISPNTFNNVGIELDDDEFAVHRSLQSSQSSEPCGDRSIGNGICADTSLCCSQFGFCDITPAHCDPETCLSGPGCPLNDLSGCSIAESALNIPDSFIVNDLKVSTCQPVNIGEEGPCPGDTASSSVQLWYTLVGDGSTIRASSISSEFDTRLSVFQGASCSSLQCIGYNDDVSEGILHSEVEWFAEDGQTYHIRLDDYECDYFYQNYTATAYVVFDYITDGPTLFPTFSGATSTPGNNEPTLFPTPGPTPEITTNRDCEKAKIIYLGENVTETFDRDTATACEIADLDEGFPCAGKGGTFYITEWFVYTGQGMVVRASTEFSEFATSISVFQGNSCSFNDKRCIAYSDISAKGSTDYAELEWFASFNTIYFIRVEDQPCTFFSSISPGSYASITFSLRLSTSPGTSTQPPITEPTTAPTNNSTDPDTPSNGDDSSNIGAIVGGVAGAFVAIVLIAFAFRYLGSHYSCCVGGERNHPRNNFSDLPNAFTSKDDAQTDNQDEEMRRYNEEMRRYTYIDNGMPTDRPTESTHGKHSVNLNNASKENDTSATSPLGFKDQVRTFIEGTIQTSDSIPVVDAEEVRRSIDP